jgi:Calx-beta domain/FG-GAP-like repeat
MSFHNWLHDLRSVLATTSNRRRHRRRRSLRAAALSATLEKLEDRCLLSFDPVASFLVGTNPRAVVTGDFNSDGRLDLATANAGSDSVSVLLGNGQGGFGAASHVGAGDRPVSLTAADFNNDGHLDLVTGTAGDSTDPRPNSVSLMLGVGDGTFQVPVDIVTDDPWQFTSVAAADFDSDGNMDIVYVIETIFDPPEMYTLLGDGRGGFEFGSWASEPEPVAIAVADLNADGFPDVVTANYYDTVSVLLGAADYAGDFATGVYPRAVAVGDFTGDGIPDLVTAGRTVDILPGLGDGTFSAAITHSMNATGMTTVAAADFDSDGNLDVVTAAPNAGTVSVLLGHGDGTLAPPIDQASGSSPGRVALGDFNLDGRTDVVAANTSSNAVSVLLNDGIWDGTPPPPPPLPSIAISDVTKAEGKNKTTSFTFTVTLSQPSTQTVTVQFATTDGSASVSDRDYSAKSGTLTFLPGQTSKTVTIAVRGDKKAEGDETFFVNLSSAQNALIDDGQGVGTILNDDGGSLALDAAYSDLDLMDAVLTGRKRK